MDAPFVPSFFVSTSLSAENICGAQITRVESNLKGKEGGARIRGRSSLLFARLLRQLFKEGLTARYGKMWNDKQRPQQSGVRQSEADRQSRRGREDNDYFGLALSTKRTEEGRRFKVAERTAIEKLLG